MPSPIKENGRTGALIQVFVPNRRLVTDEIGVDDQDIVRFSADGSYELNGDGLKVPFPAGRTIGIPSGVNSLRIFNTEGTVQTAQIIEIM